MSTTNSILGIVPGLQATALVGANLESLDFVLEPKKRRGSSKRRTKKPNHIKRIVKIGVTNLIAIPLIGASASMINQIS